MKTVSCGFSGGENTATDPTEITPDECVVALNWDYSKYAQGSTRRGYVRLTNTRFKDASGYPFQFLGVRHFYGASEISRDIFVGFPAGGSEELRYVTGHTATKVTYDADITPGTSGYPYSFENIGDRLIGCNGETTNWSWNGTAGRNAFPLGIATPSTAPSVADGGAGALTGNFRYVVIFKDGVDDVKSAASPLSALISISGKQVALTNIPVSASSRVTQRLIYRTMATGFPPYYLVGTIADNTTTTYTDNTTDSASGTEMVEGGQPPVARIAVAFKGVLWLFSGTIGYYSQPRRPEEFAYGADTTKGFYDFGTGGGDVLGAYVAGEQLVVMQERKIWVIYDDPRVTPPIEVHTQQGQDWAFAGCVVSGQVIYANREALFSFGANSFMKIMNKRGQFMPQGDWDSITNQPGQSSASYGNEVRVVHHEKARQIWIGATNSGPQSSNNFTLVYNYWRDQGPWSKYSFGFDVVGEWRFNFSDVRTLVFAQDGLPGYLFRADYGPLDSIASAGTMFGRVESATSTTITDTDASFPTDGEGLYGAVVTLVQQTTKVRQTATIQSNTATQLTFNGFTRFTPVAGDLYIIGGFSATVKGGRMDWGDAEAEKATRRLRTRIESV